MKSTCKHCRRYAESSEETDLQYDCPPTSWLTATSQSVKVTLVTLAFQLSRRSWQCQYQEAMALAAVTGFGGGKLPEQSDLGHDRRHGHESVVYVRVR